MTRKSNPFRRLAQPFDQEVSIQLAVGQHAAKPPPTDMKMSSMGENSLEPWAAYHVGARQKPFAGFHGKRSRGCH